MLDTGFSLCVVLRLCAMRVIRKDMDMFALIPLRVDATVKSIESLPSFCQVYWACFWRSVRVKYLMLKGLWCAQQCNKLFCEIRIAFRGT